MDRRLATERTGWVLWKHLVPKDGLRPWHKRPVGRDMEKSKVRQLDAGGKGAIVPRIPATSWLLE